MFIFRWLILFHTKSFECFPSCPPNNQTWPLCFQIDQFDNNTSPLLSGGYIHCLTTLNLPGNNWFVCETFQSCPRDDQYCDIPVRLSIPKLAALYNLIPIVSRFTITSKHYITLSDAVLAVFICNPPPLWDSSFCTDPHIVPTIPNHPHCWFTFIPSRQPRFL